MTKYLISFDDGVMETSEEDRPEVARAAHAVDQRAKDAGGWLFSGGLTGEASSVVAIDGTVTNGSHPGTKARIGGFMVVDVPSREEALSWAARIAVACRCAQEVREFILDPTD